MGHQGPKGGRPQYDHKEPHHEIRSHPHRYPKRLLSRRRHGVGGHDPGRGPAGELLAAWRQARRPIFHVQHLAPGPDATFFRPDTPGVEIHASVRPLPGEALVRKQYPNAFRDTGLLEVLQGAGVEEVIICGAMSHMCVDATTRAAFDYGFEVHRHPRRLRHPGPGLSRPDHPRGPGPRGFYGSLGDTVCNDGGLKEILGRIILTRATRRVAPTKWHGVPVVLYMVRRAHPPCFKYPRRI